MMQHNFHFADDVVFDGVKNEGNVAIGFFAGIIAAIIGTVLWVGFTVQTGQEAEYLAIGVAMLIALTVRFLGGGHHAIFGLMGAVFTLLSIATSEFCLAVASAADKRLDFYQVMNQLDLVQLVSNLVQHASVASYAIYAISIVGAYLVSVQNSDTT